MTEIKNANPDEVLWRRLDGRGERTLTFVLRSGLSLSGRIRQRDGPWLIVDESEGEAWLRLADIAAVRGLGPASETVLRAPAAAPPAPPAPPAPDPLASWLTAARVFAGHAAFAPPEEVEPRGWHPLVLESDRRRFHQLRAELQAAELGLGPETVEAIRALGERHPACPELWRLRAHAHWKGGDDESAVDAFLHAAILGDRRSWKGLAFAHARRDRPAEAILALRAYFDHAAANGASKSEPELRSLLDQAPPISEGLLDKAIASIRNAQKFAGLEEDINGIIAEAEALFTNRKVNSAFDKLNEGYALSPGHPRVREAERALRSRGDDSAADLEVFEGTLNYILTRHDLVLFDTSVLSLQDHSRDSIEDDWRPRLEDKVAYHKLIERAIRTWPQKIYCTQGVLDEIQGGVGRMRNRDAKKSFGKSAESLARELAACREVEFDDHLDKRLRTLKATFGRLRSKGGLSDVDYDLVCRAFVLALDREVALLSNDRGIHEGVALIKRERRAGNRNIKFLQAQQVCVYTSLHKSHFELINSA